MGFFDLLQISAPVFLVLIIGFAVRRMKLLTEEADHTLLRLTINLFYPSLLLDLIIGNEALLRWDYLLLPPVFGFVTVAAGFGASWLGAKWAGIPAGPPRRTFSFTCGLPNYGYLALPICFMLFGRETSAVLLGYNLGVEIAYWGLGLMVLTGEWGMRGLRKIWNVPVLSLLVALGLNLAGAGRWMPEWIDRTYTMLGYCAVPVALLLTGALFADYAQPAHFLESKRTFGVSLLVRLGVMPVFFLLLAWLLPLETHLRQVLVVQGAMPAAVAPLAVARFYGGDVPTGFKVILGTTLAGFVTVPLWLFWGIHFLRLH
ncbi:MAG TPA: AEC family transporter [Chthoniobacterales bacterium]